MLSRLVVALVLLFIIMQVPFGANDASAMEEGDRSGSAPDGTFALYLPVVSRPDPFSFTPAIWPHASTPAAHEVALFRRRFRLEAPLVEASLSIFADTRYELWVDGEWVGRGPARFSNRTREYDRYDLHDLAPGSHLVAVLVQWAPNERRSESQTPILQAHIRGRQDSTVRVIMQTGNGWKAIRSRAWREDAAPVHRDSLLGPTEILDFRQLPHGWMHPGYDDSHWPAAVRKPATSARHQRPPTYRPRSIPPLQNVPIGVTPLEAGGLSPGHSFAEVWATPDQPFKLPLHSSSSTPVTLRALQVPTGTTDTDDARNHLAAVITIDENPLDWQQVPGLPGDIYQATTTLSAGTHNLQVAPSKPETATFSLAAPGVEHPPLPFQQGSHAGRRLLLAAPVPDPDAVTISHDQQLSLSFNVTPSYALLDLGRVVHGRLVADVTGPAGTFLDIGWDERLWQDRRPLPFPGSLHPQWNQVDSWLLDGSTRRLTTIDARAGRYILIAVWGDGPVRLENLQVFEERYPVVQRVSFDSSDDRLDRIWQVGVDTLFPNMTDAYADPWRERGQWWGDAYVADHINQVAIGDVLLLRRGLRFLAESFENGRPNALAPNGADAHMLDYGMLWAQSIEDYWRRTGDATVVGELFPVLVEFMAHLEKKEGAGSELLVLQKDHWSKTAFIDWQGFYSRYGTSTALNALYYGTLLDAVALAEAVDDQARAEAWRQKAERVKQEINQRLYLPEKGHYLTNIHNGSPYPPTPHAQAWPLAYGVVPPEAQQRVANDLLTRLSRDPSDPNVEIYGMFWVLEGLARAGRHEEALNIIKHYYGYLLDLGATTWWELFISNQPGRYSSALSHAWGGSPTWFLSTHLAGLRQVSPGRWELRPAFVGPQSLNAAIPLQNDEFKMAWSIGDCERYVLTLIPPPRSSGTVIFPLSGNEMSLLRDGELIWQAGQAYVEGVVTRPDGIHVTHVSRAHRFELQHACPSS